jgi:RNA polymerase sigma-70 factor (ECF subfamily)
MDFASLYRQYAPDVFRFSYYLSGRRDLAEDITAETFARALGAADRIHGGTVKAYLLSIARNLFLDAMRRQRHLSDASVDEIDARDPAPSPAVVTEGRIDLELTRQALARLPETERSALLMSTVHGFSHEQIGAVLDCSVGAVKLRIHRARLRLRELTARGRSLS